MAPKPCNALGVMTLPIAFNKYQVHVLQIIYLLENFQKNLGGYSVEKRISEKWFQVLADINAPVAYIGNFVRKLESAATD